jgi:hypothetical protein
MSAGKVASFVVAVLVALAALPMAGCSTTVTAATPGGASSPAGGGVFTTSSPVSYKPSELPESPRGGASVHSAGRLATRIQRR